MDLNYVLELDQLIAETRERAYRVIYIGYKEEEHEVIDIESRFSRDDFENLETALEMIDDAFPSSSNREYTKTIKRHVSEAQSYIESIYELMDFNFDGNPYLGDVYEELIEKPLSEAQNEALWRYEDLIEMHQNDIEQLFLHLEALNELLKSNGITSVMICADCRGRREKDNPEWLKEFDRVFDNAPSGDVACQWASRNYPRKIICENCNGTGMYVGYSR